MAGARSTYFDEQDFVADLAIEKLVDGASGEEKTEAAGWQALFSASADVGDEVVGGFGDRFFSSEIGSCFDGLGIPVTTPRITKTNRCEQAG